VIFWLLEVQIPISVKLLITTHGV